MNDIDVRSLEEEYQRLYNQGRLKNSPSFSELLEMDREERSCHTRYCITSRLLGFLPVFLVLSLFIWSYSVIALNTLFPLIALSSTASTPSLAPTPPPFAPTPAPTLAPAPVPFPTLTPTPSPTPSPTLSPPTPSPTTIPSPSPSPSPTPTPSPSLSLRASPSPSPSSSIPYTYKRAPFQFVCVVFFTILYHVVLFFALWSYGQVMFTDPGTIPLWFVVTQIILDAAPPPPTRGRRSLSAPAPAPAPAPSLSPSTTNTSQDGDGEKEKEREQEEGREGGGREKEGEKLEESQDDSIHPLSSSHTLLGERVVDNSSSSSSSSSPSLFPSVSPSLKDLFHPLNGRGMPLQTRKDGGVRRCAKCFKPKPDRSHHCRICKRCILKMDHHCPWVNNCVGWGNYKFFFTFVFWAAALSITNFLYSSVALILYSETGNLRFWNYHQAAICFTAILLSGVLTSFFSTHVRYIKNNESTIESIEKKNPIRLKTNKKKESTEVGIEMGTVAGEEEEVETHLPLNPFDLGWEENMEEVLGTNKLLWLIPVWTSLGNGVYFRSSVVEGVEAHI